MSANQHDVKLAVHTMARDVPSMAVRAGVHSVEHGLFLTEADMEALGQRGGMWVPTVLNVEKLIVQLGPESSGGRLLTEGLDNVCRLLPLAVEAGVHVLAGTDLAVSSANVGQEAVRLAELGLSPDHTLRSVSVAGFAATGRPTGYEVGAPADAVLFDSNPLEELGVLAHPSLLMRHGVILK